MTIELGQELLSVIEWISTYWIHSSLLIGLVIVGVKTGQVRDDSRGEILLKVALLAGLVTSLVSTLPLVTSFANTPLFKWQLLIGTQQSDSQPEQARGKLRSHSELTATSEHANVVNRDNATVFEDSNLGHSLNSSNKSNKKGTQSVSNLLDASEKGTRSLESSVQAMPKADSVNWISTSNLLGLVILAWLMLSLVVATRKYRQLFKLKWALSERTVIEDGLMVEIMNSLIERADLSPGIKLSQCKAITSPLVISNQEVIVPQNFESSLANSELEAALAHELAHIKRNDLFWLNLGVLMEVIFAIQPLNRWLNMQIHQLAELRADRLAAEWIGDAHVMAKTLSTVASFQFVSAQPCNNLAILNDSSPAQINKQFNEIEMVLAMKSEKSNLVVRVEKLLEKKKATTQQAMILTLMIATFTVLFTAPGLDLQAASSNKKVNHSSSTISLDDDGLSSYTMTSIHDGETLKVRAEIDGALQFSDDESELIKFPKNSFLDITDDNGRIERRLRVEREDNETNYTFYREGAEADFDGQAKQWFAQIIPVFLRMSGIDAENRVMRIQKRLGDDGVISEVNQIKSDHVAALYLQYLLQTSQLSSNNLMKAIEATNNIGSDFEHARVLKLIVSKQREITSAHWLALLQSTKRIGSDFEQAGVLKHVITQLPADETIQLKLIDVAASIGSDFEMRRVFSSYLKSDSVTDKVMIALLESATKIGSDFELGSLMIEIADKTKEKSSIFDAYLTLAKSIGSDFELRKTLSHLVKIELSQEQLEQVVRLAANSIGSDFELASLLVEVIEQHDLNSDLVSLLKRSARKISSGNERSRVMDRLIDKTS